MMSHTVRVDDDVGGGAAGSSTMTNQSDLKGAPNIGHPATDKIATFA